MMKVVIIGGGIAGLCMGIYLRRNGVDVNVNERVVGLHGGGHAFLMHHEGMAILNELQTENCMLPGKLVDTFVYKRQDGELINELPLDEWQCFKRTDLTAYLSGLMDRDRLFDKRNFSHFIFEGDRIVAAAFLNGDVEYGDLFIGADGANSIVRKQIFGEVDFRAGRVKEIVGVVEHAELAAAYSGVFTKFQHSSKGLAFGMIPTTSTELVWFMQYDPLLLGNLERHSPEELKLFCQTLLKGFPAAVCSILEQNDFSTSYLWNTRDFDLLPAFHHENVVLIGDAAHLALPFTSAGTTNAMVDAKVLANCLLEEHDYAVAFARYYEKRAPQVAKHVFLGREIRDAFLRSDQPDFTLPLITDQ